MYRRIFFSITIMLFAINCFSQTNFNKVDNWLSENLESLGGRAVLIVYKDDKIIYSKTKNELSDRKKNNYQVYS